MSDAHQPARLRFAIADATALLSRTPVTLDTLLRGLPDAWTRVNEGPGTWSPFDVIGHLVHGERSDWLPRVRIVLEHGEARPFDPFDRDAQFATSAGKKLPDLLDEFAGLRAAGLAALSRLELSERDLDRTGRHPALGRVTLRQLLATWVAHDLDHVSQVARVLARQYAEEVGPWRAYLRIISGAQG